MDPPRIAEPVRIAAPGLDRISAEVVERAAGWLGVRVVDFAAPVARLLGKDVAIEWIRDEGIYRVLGRIEPADSVLVGSPLRFVASTRPHLLDRREHVRTDAEVLIVLSPFDASTRMLGRTRNLSAGGMLVTGLAEPPPVGTRLAFSLVLPGRDGMVRGRCRTVRATPDGDVAFSFEALRPESIDAITRFAYEQTATQRASMRGRRPAA